MNRREFLKGTLATAGAVSAASTTIFAQQRSPQATASAAVDTNVSLFQWPFRRLPHDSTAALLEKLQEHQIAQAWAGNFEGILQRDLIGVNDRLTEECRRSRGRLIPFGSVNPMLPDWEEDLRRCHEVHRMPGIRLHPNYHGYTLADPNFKRLLAMAAERSLLVQIAILLEDTRTMHPMMAVADVDATPLPALIKETPRARVLLLNSGKLLRGALFETLNATPGIYFDTARIEGAGGVGTLLRRLPQRVVFGTHAPFFIYESAVIKIVESDMTAAETRALVEENPRRLLAG